MSKRPAVIKSIIFRVSCFIRLLVQRRDVFGEMDGFYFFGGWARPFVFYLHHSGVKQIYAKLNTYETQKQLFLSLFQ